MEQVILQDGHSDGLVIEVEPGQRYVQIMAEERNGDLLTFWPQVWSRSDKIEQGHCVFNLLGSWEEMSFTIKV